MRLFTIASLSILVLVGSSQQQEDIYVACKGDFAPGPNICDKFAFISSTEAVMKGCVNPKNGTTFYSLNKLPLVHRINPNTVKMASLITNVFEDGDANFAYASCSDIHDKRGFTCGYAGFTTGTGDAETLIRSYTDKRPHNKLAQYLDPLHKISQLQHCDRDHRGSTATLGGFCEAWKQEACDKNCGFSQLQKEWVYTNYMLPSARYAAHNGVTSPLGQAIFYDAIIQHGFQYVEPDINIARILSLTGGRKVQESEPDFLKRFLVIRRQLQCCYPDNVWPASATRCEDFLSLLDDFEKYKNLNVPIPLKNFERVIHGNEDTGIDAKRCK